MEEIDGNRRIRRLSAESLEEDEVAEAKRKKYSKENGYVTKKL